MKVTFKGNVKLRGGIEIKRSSPKRKMSPTAARKGGKKEEKCRIEQLRRELARLRAGIRRDLRRELFSDRFADFIRDAVSNRDELRDIAKQYLNQPVEVATTAGPVAGTLIRVGEDYMVIQESASTQLIIPFDGTIGIRPQ